MKQPYITPRSLALAFGDNLMRDLEAISVQRAGSDTSTRLPVDRIEQPANYQDLKNAQHNFWSEDNAATNWGGS